MDRKVCVFPQPQKIKVLQGDCIINADFPVIVSKSASSIERGSAKLLQKYIHKISGLNLPLKEHEISRGKKGIFISFDSELPEQGYSLSVDSKEVILNGGGAEGIFYGVQTLKQLFEIKNRCLTLPQLRIKDWPQYKYRGIFMEDKWGPDLMTLKDWKDLIDFMAEIKFNVLGIGLYGCWYVQYKNKITEFLFVPLKGYPKLKTPKKIEYYSPAKGKIQTINYLPCMFSQDFLGEVIAYGRQRNIIVYPYFNSLGHNTLIPREYPQISAKDIEGKPTGYGYCLSNPDTYKILFDIYGQIIDRYLKPQGVDFFHLELDEIYEVIGVDLKDPRRRVDPWCKCPLCRRKSRENLFMNYLFKLCKFLRNKGIKKICLWHDQLFRMGLINQEFVRRLKKEGLFDHIALHWWYYGSTLPNPHIDEHLCSHLGLHCWVTPMTCYFNWSRYGSYLENIFNLLHLGKREGCEGAQSYSVYSPSFHPNFYCLSEYSWNQSTTGKLENFRNKYAYFLFGEGWKEAKDAMKKVEKLVPSEGELAQLLMSLTYYPYTYPNAQLPYPRKYPEEILEKLSKDSSANKKKLRKIVEIAGKAEKSLSAYKKKKPPSPFLKDSFLALIDNFLAEYKRIKNLAEEFILLLEVKELKGKKRTRTRIRAKMEKAIALHNEMMEAIEKAQPFYLLPRTLGDLTPLYRYLHRPNKQ